MDSVRHKSKLSTEPINNDDEGEHQSENHQILSNYTNPVSNSTPQKTAFQNDDRQLFVPNKTRKRNGVDVQQRENPELEVMDVDQRDKPPKNEQDDSDPEEEKSKIQPKVVSPQKSTASVAQKKSENNSESPEEVMPARSQKRIHQEVSDHSESSASPSKRSKVSSEMPSKAASATLQIEPVSMEITQESSSSEDKSQKSPQKRSVRKSQNDSVDKKEDSPPQARPPRRSCVKVYIPPKTPEPRRTPLEIIEEIIRDLPPFIPRGHIIPTGLQRVPFHLTPLLKKHENILNTLTTSSLDDDKETKVILNKVPKPDKHIDSILKALKIQDNSGFPEAVEPTDILKRRVLIVQQNLKPSKNRFPKGTAYAPLILEGEQYQANIDEEPSGVLPGTEEDRDEVIWSSEDVEAYFRKDERKLDDFYRTIDEQYLFSIWRQFESHIQPEVALQHLHQNNFDIPMSLHTVDQRLKDLPQKMKAPCKAQTQVVRKYMYDELMSMRKMQEMGMRNYHLGELITFKWNLERFFNDDGEMNTTGCNCLEPKCRPIDFEPRYGCSNCVKGQKRLSPDKLCLICQTFQNLTGTQRSGRNVVFDEEEKQKIRLWTRKERELKRSLSREEFEDLVQTETTQRHLKLNLTREEVLMLNFSLLKLEDLGKQIADQLQPYTLPHLPQCQCQKSGSIARLAPNFEKFDFTDEEAELFWKTLIASKGDIVESAKKLGVEIELVERSLEFGSRTRSRFWMKNKQLEGYAKFPPRQILPAINAPESIPDY